MRNLEIHPLGDLAAIERNTIAPSAIQSGTTYVGLENIESDGGFKGVKPVDSGDLASSKFRFTNEHILFGKLRPYLRKIAAPDFSGICSTDILPIKPGPRLEGRFLLHYLRQPKITEFFSSQSVGVNLPRVSPRLVAAVKIPLPPLPEQRRIADILDRAEALRTKRRSALAQLDELPRAIFAQMFSGPSEQVPLTNVCSSPDHVRCGPFGTQLNKSEFLESGVPLWGIKQVNAEFTIQTGEFVSKETALRLKDYSIEPLDIVMTRKGTIGNCAVYPEDWPVGIMHSDLLRIRTDSQVCLPSFLTCQLRYSESVRKQMHGVTTGAIMPGINVTKLRELRVKIPPLPLQQEFARRIQAIDRLKSLYRHSLAQLDALFQSLQHRAFRGEL